MALYQLTKPYTISARLPRLLIMHIARMCCTAISNLPICCCNKNGCSWPTSAWPSCSQAQRFRAARVPGPALPNTWSQRRQEQARPSLQKVILSNVLSIQQATTPETPQGIAEMPRPATYYPPDAGTYLANTPPSPASYYGYNAPTYQSGTPPFPLAAPPMPETPPAGLLPQR